MSTLSPADRDAQLLELLAETLWPAEDPEAPWSPGTLDTIAALFVTWRPDLVPVLEDCE